MILFADMEPNSSNQTSPRPSSSASVPGLLDCHPGGRENSSQEAGTNIPPPQSQIEEFDITVSNLPEKLGFSLEFREDLKSVGGSVHVLAEKLLNTFNLDDLGSFRAGRLCSTAEQLEFYSKTLDAGPMVTRWLSSGYEIPFTQLPSKFLGAKNNKSCINNLAFAREELKGRLKVVSCLRFHIDPL